MDRSPPGPGTGGENSSARPGGYADDPNRMPPASRFPATGSGDGWPEPPRAFDRQHPPAAETADSGYPAGHRADAMPTMPIPRPPDGADDYPTDPALAPPVGARPTRLPPATGYPVPAAEIGAPGGYAHEVTEPIPNARYEGDWSDWMLSSDGYPPRPGGEVTDPLAYAPETEPADEPPIEVRPADDGGETPVANAPEPDNGTEPTTARERLRARLTPRETAAPISAQAVPGAPGRNRLLPVLLGAAGVVALGAAAYVQFAVVGADESTPAPTAANRPGSAVPGVPSAADPNCPAERLGNTVQGNGPGGTGSGPEAIFGFQHAYYVARSGEQARTLVAPDAAVPPAADIQQGIDGIPPGTTHCLRITPGAFVGQYTVVVTEHRPGAAPLEYNPQLVTTIRVGDRTVITGIGPMP